MCNASVARPGKRAPPARRRQECMVCSTQQGRGARARSGGCGPSGRWGGVEVGVRGCGVGAGLKASGAGEAPSSTVPRRLPGAGTAVGGSVPPLSRGISLPPSPSLFLSLTLGVRIRRALHHRRGPTTASPVALAPCHAESVRCASALCQRDGRGGAPPSPSLSRAHTRARASTRASRRRHVSARARPHPPHAPAFSRERDFVSPHTAERVSASGGSESVPKERCVILGGC